MLGSTESDVLERDRSPSSPPAGSAAFAGQINYRALGRTAVLVTADVPDDKLAAVGQLVSGLPGVSHNYIRRHRFNLWFTLQGTSEGDIDRQLAELSGQTGVVFHPLPALRLVQARCSL